MDSLPKVSIILSIFNKEKTIKALLRALLKSSLNYPNLELVLIYDGCIDKTKEIAKKALTNFKGTIIELEVPNIFETRSNNLGLKNATGEYCVIIQDDNYIYDKFWINNIVNLLTKSPEIGVLGGLAGANFFPLNYDANSNPEIFKTEFECYLRIDPTKDKSLMLYLMEVDAVMRGPIFFRKDLLTKHGYLDEIYAPLYNDDMDYCFRIKSLGYKVILYPINVINNNLSINYSNWGNNKWKDVFVRNQKIFYGRWSKDMGRHNLNKQVKTLL